MATDENSGWCTILSDPAVFTDLLRDIGVKNVQVEELYALDRALFEQVGPIHGLVFLFRYRPNEKDSAAVRPGKVLTSCPSNIFFANQVINNACATQAILSIVLNAKQLDIGDDLRFFQEFTAAFDPMDRGLAISNSETLRTCHNAFAPQHQFVIDNNVPDSEKEEPYHFVAFLPIEGNVYELDGLQPGPRQHGSYGGDNGDWLDVVKPVLEARMAEYSAEGEIRFTLLAVVDDIANRLEKELDALPEDSAMRADITARIAQEREKRSQWSKENARRKFNFVPFIVEALKLTARTGQLDGVIERATERRKRAAASSGNT